jgi:hypothetical protein
MIRKAQYIDTFYRDSVKMTPIFLYLLCGYYDKHYLRILTIDDSMCPETMYIFKITRGYKTFTM